MCCCEPLTLVEARRYERMHVKGDGQFWQLVAGDGERVADGRCGDMMDEAGELTTSSGQVFKMHEGQR